MIKKLLAPIAAFLTFLFGKITWTCPPWMEHLRNKSNPKLCWGIIATVLVLTFLGFYSYHWYQSRPKPKLIVAQITPPKITPNEKILVPNPLKIDFGMIINGELSTRSVAPLNLVGQEIKEGISITPAIPGKWLWENDSQLTFTPAIDWPAGQTYSIKTAKNFFAPNAKMESFNYGFSTLPFDAAIDELKLYQDPVNPQIRQVVATIHFSYPVDPNSLEKHLALQYQTKPGINAESVKYTINYDDNKREAYIRSENLSLPQEPRYVALTVDKGVKPAEGSSATQSFLSKNVLIPDASTYFKINKVDASIVRNQKDQPEQVLIIASSIGVTQSQLDKGLHVYLLPKDYPATNAEQAKSNYEWKEPGEVTAKILAQSQSVTLEAIPADRDYATLHSYKFKAATPSYLYVKLDKGMQGFGDFVLSNDYLAIVKVPEYPQQISFLHKGALLALGTDEKLSVLVRGLGAVKFNFNRILPDDVNHLITQTNGNFNDPYFIDTNFNQDNISEIFSQIQQFDASDPAKAQYTALDLSKYSAKSDNNSKPLGLFLLQARGWNTETQTALDVQSNRLILITDMGLIVKDNNDGTHDLFVQSITKGTPVENASVAILGKNGLPIFTRATDAQGHANFPTLKDFEMDKEPTVYLVRKDNDVSFIPYNRFDRQLNFSRFDIGGVYSQPDAALSAFIFTERGIYRPGELAHIAMIVKQPYVMPQTPGLPLQITITDPRGVTVKDEKITLNESGYLTLDFKTDATAPTGQYHVNLFIVKDNHASNLIGSATMHVAEFLPDRLRITEHLSQESTQGWVSPNNLTAKVSLYNLYGAPAVDHRIGGRILLAPQAIKFTQYPNYIFVDPLFDPKSPPKTFTDTLTDTKTNDKGQAELELKLDRFEKATYQMTVFAEGFEAEGGRSVTTQTTALVSPLNYFVGYKADGDLNYIKQNGERGVNFIAVNPALKQQGLENLKIQLFKLLPVTTLAKKADGTYQYQSIIQNTEISSKAFSITEQGTNYPLETKDIGDYLISVLDQNGTELSRFKYSIVGSGQLPLPKNAELNVKLNKTEFAPGEEIEMQITAPYTGAGLITIERDKVYASQWFKADTTASVQKIKIPADFQGGGYVNIAYVRDLNSAEIFMSPLSYSVAAFEVTHKNHEIQIDLTVPEWAKPGDTLPITYKTDKPSKIIVFAVDEGILQVSKYLTPDPIKFFFQKHALEVNTQQIVDQILPKFIAERELSSVGGDGGEGALLKNLNPFKRKTEAPVVYWSGIIDSDTNAKQLSYQIPDYFNGAIRVMAVTVATDAVGATSKTTQVRGDFVINPNAPTFVAPGDEFEVTASIANNVKDSGANANVAVEMTTTPQLEMIDSAKQTITIPEGQERSVHYRLRAKSELASAELKFIASMNDKSSKISSTLSVRPAIPYLTSVISGYAKDAKKTINLDRILYPEYREAEAAISSNPLILVLGLQTYLDKYPYGCTEQIVSQAFPLLMMSNQTWFIEKNNAVAEKVQQRIQILSQRQMSNGGFAYWPDVGSTNGNDFASIYAMHFLTEARELKFNVPSEMFSAGIAYLKDFVTQEVTTLEQARLHAYAIYILTRNEIVTTNYLTNLQLTLEQHPDFHWQTDITSVYIAATYQLLQSTTDADKFIKYFKLNATTNSEPMWNDFYNQNTANAVYLYLVAKHFPDMLKQIDDKFVLSLVDSLNDDSITTILSSYTSLALAAYGQSFAVSNDTNLTINALLLDGKSTELGSTVGLYKKASIAENVKSIIFNNNSQHGYFYQITQSGFDKELPQKAQSHGIEVYREYHNADDKKLGDIHLGDEIIVHLRIRATDDQYHNNIAIVDLLPGGFEVVRDSVKLQDMDYVDAREDRVIYFGYAGTEAKEIVYRIKATNSGKFTVPPSYAMAMYNPTVKSLGVAENIEIVK